FSGDLIIPNSIRYFGYQVFYGCSGFDGILNIPNSLDTLGHGAFEGCSGLRQIIITDTTPPIIDESTFNNVNKSLCQLVVPSGSIPVYKNAAYWNEFKNITNLSTVNSPQISINNMNETGFLRLFQNHSVKSVNIEAEKIRSIVVYNLLGIVILRYNSIGRECVNLNIANLKSGNYLVKGTFFNGAVNFLRMTVF
ncbi:MAG TPA: leucine-rich repeat protein, partial [Chitinispirillaceae bacterium]|nr:leucine-rich repeat protein [Chitinispirillaceae bacterium]